MFHYNDPDIKTFINNYDPFNLQTVRSLIVVSMIYITKNPFNRHDDDVYQTTNHRSY